MDLTIDKDLAAATLTVTAEFAHPAEKVWDLFADPRKLERWWGPPGFPATVVLHELRPGGVVHYYMTSAEDERFDGRWDVQTVDAPASFTFTDAFADADGTPLPDMPVSTVVLTLDPTDDGSTLRMVTTFASTEALSQVLEMGMEEGMTQALEQTEAILAPASPAQS